MFNICANELGFLMLLLTSIDVCHVNFPYAGSVPRYACTQPILEGRVVYEKMRWSSIKVLPRNALGTLQHILDV